MRIIRTSTMPGALNSFCRVLLHELQEQEDYEVVPISSPGDALAEIEQHEGVRTVAVEMQQHISPLKNLKSLWQMIKVFHRERPTMVHSITPKPRLLSMMEAWLCRMPMRVHMFTGLVFPTSTGLKRRILMATDKLPCVCATHIIPEGEGVKSDLQQYNVTKNPLRIRNILHVFTLAMTAESFFDGQFRYLSNNGYHTTVIASTELPKDFCERNFTAFHKADIARRIDILADLKSISELTAYIKSGHFDAVFGHTPKGAMVAMIAARLAGVKTRIYYRHGLIYTTTTGLKRFVLKSVERFTAVLATKIVNVSPSLSKLAIKDRLNSDKRQCVIGSGTCGGIDATEVFNPELLSAVDVASLRKSLIGEADFVVGFCGRLCKDKGIVELVDGFNLFKERHPQINAKFLLVGPFDDRDILAESTKKEIKNNPDIIATGRQDKSKLPALYSLMDVFVFPSYREGFGMSVIEASAMEVPILVSRSHGCVDSIKENVTGQYVEISPESIASGLSDMLDADLRHQLGKCGRQFILNNFDYKVMWPLIKQLYDETFFNQK